MIHTGKTKFWCTTILIRKILLCKVIAFVLFTHMPLVLGTIEQTGRIHFKIHVPEIINHHIHTKMVLIHEDGDEEQEPQSDYPDYPYSHGETFDEQWSSWNNNGQLRGQHRNKLHKYNYPGYDRPSSDIENDIYMGDEGEEEDLIGFTYPPKYSDGRPNNDIESYMENTFKQGLHSETGHLITNNQNNFYDVNQEEADLTDHGYYHEETDKRNLHSHHQNYDKEIGREDRVSMPTNRRKYFVVRMIPR